MHPRSRSTRVFMLCATLALGISATLVASAAKIIDLARLTAISSRVDDRVGSVAIEASDPVPYVASQPDPHTFVLELRDVRTVGLVDRFAADPRSPISSVRVESSRTQDGTDVARIRLTLTDTTR